MNDDAATRARFEALARQHGADLYRFGLWLCGDDALAKDLVQETFLRAWRALDSLQDDQAAKRWMITILRREYARTFERKVPPLTDVDAIPIEDRDSPSPEQRLERDQLRRGILGLAPRYREPLLLQVVVGLSCEEIAAELAISKSAVMTRLFRARGQLAGKLDKETG